MYKIKNITKGKLLLTDLGIKLGAGETIDLDALLPREKIESSVHLKVAETNELIAITHKDIVAVPSPSIDPAMLMEMEQRIRAQITEQMASAIPVTNNTQDLTGITSKLEQLLAAVQKGPQIQNNHLSDLTEDTIDADKLVAVHAKALQRLTKSAEGHVEAASETHTSNVSDIADELGDFLK